MSHTHTSLVEAYRWSVKRATERAKHPVARAIAAAKRAACWDAANASMHAKVAKVFHVIRDEEPYFIREKAARTAYTAVAARKEVAVVLEKIADALYAAGYAEVQVDADLRAKVDAVLHAAGAVEDAVIHQKIGFVQSAHAAGLASAARREAARRG
jgi:hypothetical protein